MSHTLSRPSPFQRSGLLSLVAGLHIGAFLLVMAAKTVVPQIADLSPNVPLIVDLLETPAIDKPPVAKPLPMAIPQPLKAPRTAPTKAEPLMESSASEIAPAPATMSQPAASAPVPAAPAAVPPVAPASPARFDADYLKNPAPAYPPLARRMREEGTVLLRVSVNAEGLADDVEIRTSSGSPRLDEAARKTVGRWRFIPAKRGDSAIQSWVLVPIIFKLEQ